MDRSLTSVASFELLEEIQGILNRNYLREQPPTIELEYAAAQGMVAKLGDKYTFFIEPPVAQSESDGLAGVYGGIGVHVMKSEDGRILLYPFDDSPAQVANVRDGDELIEVNGVAVTYELKQDALDQLLRGEVKRGNGVNVKLIRNNVPVELFIEFGVIEIPSVVWRILDENDGMMYIQLSRFTDRTPDELKTALDEFKRLGLEAIILDLRNNSGGLLQESVDIADMFLIDGCIIIERKIADEKVYEATNPVEISTDIPMIVLINNNTASAAELVAAALQGNQRATVIGQNSFGKGTVQQIFPLSDGSSLHVTSAEWYTANDKSLEGIGLIPDVVMIPDENGRDVELGEAIRVLNLALDS
ncbi:MAG: S41 family peptidase [Phototrophicaceae bacterium]